MPDEKLAEWINSKNICEQCAYELEGVYMKKPCANGILKRLQSEAEQEGEYVHKNNGWRVD